MENKLTPWTLNEDGDIVNSLGNLVPIIGVSLPSKNHPDRKQAEENKLLFAAAPELLEALQDVLKWYSVQCDLHYVPTLDKARAAIEKATGQK